MSSRTHPLVQALTGTDAPPPMTLRRGLVRAVDSSSSPYTCSVDVGGATLTGVPFPGWWAAEVGAVVSLLQQGSHLEVLTVYAPVRCVVGAHNHTTPPTDPTPPDAPGPAPAAPTAVRTVTVLALSTDGSATWVPAFSNWRTDRVIAGGTGQRGFWFYGTGIAAAKGAGTIIGGTIFVKRTDTGGVGGAANVRLGTHGYATRPGSGGTPLGSVAQVGVLGHDQGEYLPLTDQQVADLNAGAAGLGLEPGAGGYTTPDYLIAYPRSSGDWSGALQLTVRG